LPSSSIDTFFACSLIVSVALIAVAFAAGSLHTQIGSVEDMNEQAFLQAVADHVVSGYGVPADWGSSGVVPSGLGLAGDLQVPFSLDVDKVCRLNNESAFALGYLDLLQAARLDDLAFGVSVAQMLSVDITLQNYTVTGNVTDYVFQVVVNQDSGPLSTDLCGYVAVGDFLGNVSGETDSSGVGQVSMGIPNTSVGSGLVVVFARASFDDRLTAFGVCRFAQGSGEVSPDGTFLRLSPLSNHLNVESKSSNASVGCIYAFSYGTSWNITSTLDVPECADSSPIVLVVTGTDSGVGFVEWACYPMVPFSGGADLSRSEANVFVYTVTIRDVLYRLTLRFGDVAG
jgi:hypothetical protein